MTVIDLPDIPAAYVRTINKHEPTAFIELFADEATVYYAGRDYHGIEYIRQWSESDIFAANISLQVLDATQADNMTIIRAEAHGDFDRTVLPAPLVMEHRLTVQNDKIVRLTCMPVSGQQP